MHFLLTPIGALLYLALALVAAAMGREVTVFPGGHDGFLGGEFGQNGKPDEFAVRLIEVLGAG